MAHLFVRSRRNRAFRPAETTLILLEPRKLLASVATVSPQADPPTAQDQQANLNQDEPLLLNPISTAEEADPVYAGDPTAAQTAAVQQAINLIANSQFAQTDPGKTILNGLLDDLAKGKILPGPALARDGKTSTYVNTGPDAGPNAGNIYYDPALANDPDALATALAHEGSHQTYAARNPGANPNDPNYRLNNEFDAFQNMLNFYKQLPANSVTTPPKFKDDLDAWSKMTPDQLLQDIKGIYNY